MNDFTSQMSDCFYVVEPDRVADQLGRKTMPIMWVWRLLHSSILAQDRAARQSRLL
jgi:hypothetical protein